MNSYKNKADYKNDKIKGNIDRYNSNLYSDLYNKTITEELSDNFDNFNNDTIRKIPYKILEKIT